MMTEESIQRLLRAFAVVLRESDDVAVSIVTNNSRGADNPGGPVSWAPDNRYTLHITATTNRNDLFDAMATAPEMVATASENGASQN